MTYRLCGAAFVLLTVGVFVWASESDELRERADALQRKAAELAEHGNQEEARELKRRAREFFEEAERLEHRRHDHHRVEELRRRLEHLRNEEHALEDRGADREHLEEIRREARHVEQELREISHDRPREGPSHEPGRRLEHMRIAIEHLQQAGLGEIAEHVAKHALAAERELQRHERLDGEHMLYEVLRQLEEIRFELEQLREETRELRERR